MQFQELVDSLDDTKLKELGRLIRARRDYIASVKKMAFKVGDRVSFDSKKRGETIVGVVAKINRKNIKVNVGNGRETWTVYPSLLTFVTDGEAQPVESDATRIISIDGTAV